MGQKKINEVLDHINTKFDENVSRLVKMIIRKKNFMVDCVKTWRKKLRMPKLVNIVKNELESGTEISKICEILDNEMSFRWKLVNSTRKLYLEDVKKILANQFVLVM